MRAVLILAVALATPQMVALAHHSFAAEYDSEKPVTVSGTVTKVEWMNPHIYVTLDVKGPDGKVAQWRLEGYPPNMLVRQGWKKDVSMKVGDTVSVSGWQARAESNTAIAREVTWPDGRKLTSGPPATIGGQ